MNANTPSSKVEIKVTAAGETVVCQPTGGAALSMTPDDAIQLAERLWAAAETARAASEPRQTRTPFPPADLVSPHAAG